MEIRSLELLLTDADLVPVAALLAKQADGIEELAIAFTPEGASVQGKYPTPFFKVAFETIWQPEAAGPEVRVKLVALKVAGLPASMLRGALMKMVRDAIDERPGLTVSDDVVVVRVADMVRAYGFDLAMNFVAVRMGEGTCVIEARTP
jgi:hypothetical protein